MSSIEIKRFDPNRLDALAKEQTRIYNFATKGLPDYPPAKEEDVIKRFKRPEFDQTRMFYAFKGSKMIGYVGLTGRDKEANSRGAGYPWLDKGVDKAVRDQLYEAMEKHCRSEGTKTLKAFSSQGYQDLLSFYKSKRFETKQEFLVLQKKITKNVFVLPAGYSFKPLTKEDLKTVSDLALKDPRRKRPFSIVDLEQGMDSSDHKPEYAIVAVKAGQIVGFIWIFLSQSKEDKKGYLSGRYIVTDGTSQDLEPFLLMEMENRASSNGKEIVEISLLPDAPRLPFFKEKGYKVTAQSYQLEKALI